MTLARKFLSLGGNAAWQEISVLSRTQFDASPLLPLHAFKVEKAPGALARVAFASRLLVK